MTGALAPLGKQQYFDGNGDPLAGGLLYTYAAGTTTPKTTWTDAAQTTPNPNPVVLDSAGRASIYINGDAYKFVLKTSAGATVWTQDAIRDFGAASFTYGSILGWFNPMSAEYGALGDDANDDTDAIQAAAADLVAQGGGTLYFPFGQYRVTEQIAMAIPSSTARIRVLGDPGAVIRLDANLANNDTGLFSITGSPTRGQVTFENLKLDGDDHTGTGIKVDQCSERVTLRDVSIRDFAGRGAWLYKCVGCSVYGGHFLSNGYGLEIGGVSSIGEGGIWGAKFEDNTTRNLLMNTGITFMEVSGCQFYGPTPTKSVEIADGGFCIAFRSCSFEQANESIYCNGSLSQLTVENCLIPCQSTSGTKYGIYVAGSLNYSRIAQNVFTLESDGGCTAVGVRVAGGGGRVALQVGPNQFSKSGAGTNTEYSPADVASFYGQGPAGEIAFYAQDPVARQTLATGAGATVDNVITALQNLGLVKQS